MLKPEILSVLKSEHLHNDKAPMASVIPFSACRVFQPEKLSYYGLTEDSAQAVLVITAPYYVGAHPNRNISLYAAAKDYHLYFKAFFDRTCSALQRAFPGYIFGGSADNAPIDERHAAVTAGLGCIGDNGLLIHPVYGTYVFIGEIISDMPAELWYENSGEVRLYEATYCEHCGACRRACPMHGNNPYGIEDCLSAVTQTKQLDDPDMLRYIRYYGSAWGCDRCQTVCPHNKHAAHTEIPFFMEHLTPHITAAMIDAMDKETFTERAYAWRKKKTVMRNLNLIEKDLENGGITADTAFAVEDIIKKAGAIMLDARNVEKEEGAVDAKPGSANFVTVYDVRVQNYLVSELKKLLPDAAFMAEEKENDPSLLENGYCFIIDPIDGTTNFIHGYDTSSISVGLLYRGTPVFGAVYDPYRKEMFTARKGLGAFLNGKPIHVSSRPAEQALFTFGSNPYHREQVDKTMAMIRQLLLSGADIRNSGSAAIDLAYVACGRADGYCQMYICPWDYAAAALLIEEAGGFIRASDGGPVRYHEGCGIIAGTKETEAVVTEAAKLLF